MSKDDKKKRPKDKPVSLAPLEFEEAVSDLLNRHEVALAEALWEGIRASHDIKVVEKWHDVVLEMEMECAPGQPLPALRDFTENVEAIGAQ